MKIVEIEFKQRLDVLKKSTILTEGMKTIKQLAYLKLRMEDIREDKESTLQDNLDLIVLYEELLALDYDVLYNCGIKSIGTSGAIRRRIMSFCGLFEELRETLKPNVECFVPLDEEEFDNVYSILKESIGQLACYISYQFGFNKIKEDQPLEEITDAVDYWSRENKHTEEDIKTVGLYVNNLVMSCNPNMGVFEKYPELLIPFCNLVDEFIYDCVDVDIKTIYDVIEGRVEVQDFLKKIEERESDN